MSFRGNLMRLIRSHLETRGERTVRARFTLLICQSADHAISIEPWVGTFSLN